MASIITDDLLVRSVIWPDFGKLPVGLIVTLAGLGLGLLTKKQQGKTSGIKSEAE